MLYSFCVVTIDDIRALLNHEMRDLLEPIKTSLKYALEILLDPWEGIHSELTEKIKDESAMHLDKVSSFYGTPDKQYCMVLGRVTKCHIICAHIWPKYTMGKGLCAVGLDREDVNSPRNFLCLHKSIEKAFDKNRLCFTHNMEGDGIRFVVSILDPSLPPQKYEADGTHHPFSLLDNHVFDYKFVPPVKPFVRLIALHAIKTIENAQALGWVDAGDIPARRQRALELARLSLDPRTLNI